MEVFPGHSEFVAVYALSSEQPKRLVHKDRMVDGDGELDVARVAGT